MTAQGTTFISLEDETGLMSVIVSAGCWTKHKKAARTARALVVRGRIERVNEAINIVAEHLEPLPLDSAALASRDFR